MTASDAPEPSDHAEPDSREETSPESAPIRAEDPTDSGDAPPSETEESNTPFIVLMAVVAVLVLGVGTALVVALYPDYTYTAADRDNSTALEAPPSISLEDFDDEWKLEYGDVSMSADQIGAWEYQNCSSLEITRRLTTLGCNAAYEVAYIVEEHEIKVSIMAFVMPDAASAQDSLDALGVADFRPNKAIDIDNYYERIQKDAEERLVVVAYGSSPLLTPKDTTVMYTTAMMSDHLARFSA